MSVRWRANRGGCPPDEPSPHLSFAAPSARDGKPRRRRRLTLRRTVRRFSLARWLPALVVGATRLSAAPASAHRVFVPPTINSSTVQSNWNYWANGGYPNIVAQRAYTLALANAVFGNLYNPPPVPYVPPYYPPYLYNPALYSGSYG